MNYKIGVDGGATKTECLLVDASGAVAARHLAKGCSPSHLDPAQAGQVVREALEILVEKVAETARLSSKTDGLNPKRLRVPLQIDATLLCLAGNRAYWQEFAGSLSGFGRVVAVDDSLPILELATAGQPGLVLHGGTGSFVAARTGQAEGDALGSVHYAGGLGWRFGDPGSGYDLGRRAVGRALLELQGWEPVSGIAGLVTAHTDRKDATSLSRYFYESSGSGPEAGIAGLAPGILRLAGERDPVALGLVAASVSELLDLALRVAAKLFPAQPQNSLRAGLSGPILTDPTVVRILADRAPFPLETIKDAPIEGVRRMLARL